MKLDRRNFILGVAAIAAAGPVIAQAVAAPAPLGTIAVELEEYTSGNLLAAFLIDGAIEGPMQECNGYFAQQGHEVKFMLDRELHFPATRSGIARVRFISKSDPRMWGEMDVNAVSGCVVNITPATLHASPP